MEHKYLILDSNDNPLARGYMSGMPGSNTCRMRVEGDIDLLLSQESIRIVDMFGGGETIEGKILGSRGNIVEVSVLRTLEESLRRTLRIPVRFETLLYPVTGKWKGRLWVESYDLSCGGISFLCSHPLEIGETVEIVIPVTSQPLLLNAKILRLLPSPDDRQLYAAQFLDMVREEEAMVCEAVFGIQLRYGK